MSEADAAVDIRDRIRGGRIRSLTAAKTEAAKVWKSDLNLYNGSRATNMPGMLNYNYIVWLYLYAVGMWPSSGMKKVCSEDWP